VRPLVVVGGFKHELNSFALGTTTMDSLHTGGYYAEGAAIFEAPRAQRPELAAIREIAEREGVDLVPTVHFHALFAGGPVEHPIYERARDLILGAAREHRDELAGIMLPLHGATVTTEEDDPEGDLLERLRAIVGADIPIVATFDTHVHGTARMARYADALIGFKTQPHVDHYETATAAMGVLLRAIRGEIRPVTTHRKLRMLTSAERQDTTKSPNRDLMDATRGLERRPGVLAVSLFQTQPWFDKPEVGWSVEVVTDGDPALGAAVADELGRSAWAVRDELLVHKTPIPEALDHAAAAPHRPIAFADGSDSTSAGGWGDGNELLAALVARDDAIEGLLTVTDAAAVARCVEAGVGAELELPVGGTVTPGFSPVVVRGTVTRLGGGQMQLDPPWSSADAGRIAVLRVGATDVVLTEQPAWHLDTVIYRHVGLDPATYQVVQAKSAGGFRARYEAFAAEIVEIDTRGPCDADLPRLPFRRITRPLWPFDAELDAPWADGEPAVSTGDAATTASVGTAASGATGGAA
jgi:microcystin degradation protein MlrC